MSTIEDRAKEILKEEIDRLIELQDQEIKIGETKSEIIEKMARKLEAANMEPDKICATIKRILKENYINISEDTVEKACGIDRKRRYDRYQQPANSRENRDFQQPVTVSTSGSQSIIGPDGKEREEETEIKEQMAEIAAEHVYRHPSNDIATNRITESDEESEVHDTIAERSAEIALSTIDILKKEIRDKDIRLNEAFKMIEDKDHEIERQRLNMGEMEIRIRDLEKKPTEETAELQARYDELKAIETERTKQHDFVPASQVQSPKPVWVAAINAINFYRELNKASKYAIEHNDPWKKLLFDIASDGQLKVARLEGQ